MLTFKLAALPIADLNITYVWWAHCTRTLPGGTHKISMVANMVAMFDDLDPRQKVLKDIQRLISEKANGEDICLIHSDTVPPFVAARLQIMGYSFSPAFVDGGHLPIQALKLEDMI